MRLYNVLALCLIAGCADTKLLAENTALKLRVIQAEEQLRQQQDYVAATQDRDSQMQTDFQEAYKRMAEDWDEQVEELKQEAREWAKQNHET